MADHTIHTIHAIHTRHVMEGEGGKGIVLTGIHPMNNRLHRALRGVTVQNNTVSFFRIHIDPFFFLLGWGS